MTSQRISDMTLDELKTWVDEQVERRVQQLLRPVDPRSVKEINASIRKHRWTPPPSAPSNLELVREDRNR